MADEPLIWTSKGNLSLASLTYQHAWDDQPTYIKFCERYLDATGEVVKESAHVYCKTGLTVAGETGGFGG
jgi:hypothetical protein